MQKLLLILPLSFLLTISPASAIHISDLNLDSLWSIWHDKTQADTNRLNAIQELVDIMQHSDLDSVLSLGQLLYDLAEEKDLAKYMANGLNTQAIYFVLKHDLPKAIKLATKSLQISEELGYKQGMAQSNNILGLAYVFQGEFDKADDYCSRSLKIAEELGHKLAIAMAINSKGQISLQQGDLSGAMDNFSRLLQISEDLMNSEKNMIRKFAYENVNAKGILNIGTISMYQGDYLNSLDHFLRSLKIFEAAGNKPTAAMVRQNIGAIYVLMHHDSQAIEYLIPALEFFQENNDKPKALFVLSNLGGLKAKQGDYSEAMDYYDEGLKIAEEISDRQNTAHILTVIGEVHQKMGNYSQALAYIARGLTILEAIGDKMGLSNALIVKAQVYQKQAKYSLAITNASKGLQLAQEAGAALESRDAAKALYDAHKAMGHQQQTLESYELYIKMRDSINSIENKEEIIRQEFKYKYEKEQTLADAKYQEQMALSAEREKRQELIAYSAGGGLLLVLAFTFFIFNRLQVTRRQKKVIEEQKELVEKQKEEREIMMQEIHHRVKNNMQIVKSLLGLQAGKIDDKKIKDMFKECQSRITAMATIHENMYQSEELIRIDIDHYLKVIVEKIAYSYQMDKEITYNLTIPTIKFGSKTLVPLGLIINEIMTNSYKYAFKDRESGEITLKVKEISNTEYEMIIGDNGIGMPPDIVPEASTSLGTELIQIFIEQLGGSIERLDQPGTMYKVLFTRQEDKFG